MDSKKIEKATENWFKHLFMRIFITGGAGCVGTVLTEELLRIGHEIIVLDLFMYGDHIKDHKNLLKIKADLRNLGEYKNYLKDIDVVIHLACILNDPSFELNPKLGKSIILTVLSL